MYPAPQPASGWQSFVRRASAPGVEAPAPPTARKTARHAKAPRMTSFLTDLSPSLESAEVGLCQRNGGFAGAPKRPCTFLYGVGSAYEPPKMSVFPNVAGHACCGAGRVGSVDVPAAVPLAMSSR